MNMKRTGLLLLTLWALSWAHPVPRHPGPHHRSSEEFWATAVEESLKDLSDEDTGSRLSISAEDRRNDLGGDSCKTCEQNSFPRKVSSHSLESFSEDSHEWNTQDNDEEGYFRHPAVHRKWADNKGSRSYNYLKEISEESLDDEFASRMSLEDQNEGHLYGDNRKSKEQFDVENDGMIYPPEQVLYTFVGKGGSDLTLEEDISGDDSLDGNNAEDPGHTKSPAEGDTLQPPSTHGEQDGAKTIGQHSDDSSSSSSSSESRNLEKKDNHISDYGRRHRGDSYSSSQEDRYGFQSEEMQGDDPRTFERHDSDSHMFPRAVHSKESSQEISKEKGKGKGKAKHHSKRVEHFYYTDGDSDEDNSPEYEKNKSLKEDDAKSEVNSQLVEDVSQSKENVPSQSREDATSHSRIAVDSSSRGHSHSQSRENLNSHSRENRYSQSREEDKHSRSRKEDRHSWSREDVTSNSRKAAESSSREHSQGQSRENFSSHSVEDKHSQSREDYVHSQSREFMASQSREDENTVSQEDIKSESTEVIRDSQEKVVKKSKEIGEKPNEHSTSKSKEQESHSAEKAGNIPPRSTESREFKWQPSRSSEKSSSMEESEESAEDTDVSRLSQSASSESSKLSEESVSSDDSNSDEEQSRSSETSESKERDHSSSVRRDSQSREDTESRSDSVEDSWSRSMELESRKLMLDVYHNKPFSDYDDNDCQDGY